MKDYIAFYVIIFIFVFCASSMSADWGILMIDLGKENVSKGILLHTNADGVTEPDDKAGLECRSVPKVPPAIPNTGNHAYFIVDSTKIDNKAKEDKLWIAVEYFDKAEAGSTGILMDYDDKGDAYPNQAFALGLPKDKRTINFTDTNEWKIVIIPIEMAEFKEQGNGGDFRFHIVPYMSGKFYLNRIWVSNKELKESDLVAVKAVRSANKMTSFWGKIKQFQ